MPERYGIEDGSSKKFTTLTLHPEIKGLPKEP